MYDKETSFKIINYKIHDLSLEKTASSGSSLVIPEEYDPEFLYPLVRAVSAGEYWGCNNNSDYFAERELLGGYHTFVENAHVFTNHQNKDVANAIGAVLRADWDSHMKYVELLIKIDRKLAPAVVRGFEKGYTTDVSMGCRVTHTVCSICGNVAKTRNDFCEHVRKQRGQILPDGRKVFEFNIGPRFHDISIVLNGADKTAKVIQIITPNVMSKAASKKDVNNNLPEKVAFPTADDLEKVASDIEDVNFNMPDIRKTSGISKLADIQKEIIDKLYILALIDKGLSPEIEQEILKEEDDVVTKEASFKLNDVAPLILGSIGLGVASNYFQGKRLRGEDTNTVENLIADNPGMSQLAYMFAGYPAYKKFRSLYKQHSPKVVNGVKDTIPKVTDGAKNFYDNTAGKVINTEAVENSEVMTTIRDVGTKFKNLFSKQADDDLRDIEVLGSLDIFNDKDFINSYKKAYNIEDDKLIPIKMAMVLAQQGDDELLAALEKSGNLYEDDIDNFLKFSYDYILEDIEKRATFLTNFAEWALAHEAGGIPHGLATPALAGMALDTFLFSKLLGVQQEKKKLKNEAIGVAKDGANGVTNVLKKNDIYITPNS